MITVLAVAQLILALSVWRGALVDEEGRFRLPLPDRVAAIAAMVETVPAAQRETLLRALEAEDFSVAVVADLPSAADREDFAVDRVSRAVGRYVDAAAGREVIAWIAPGADDDRTGLRFEATRLWSSAPLRIAVRLAPGGADGDWLLIETRDRLAARVFGLPPGFWAGVLGAIVAIVSVVILGRGVAPLGPLARNVEAFGRDAVPRPTPEQGLDEVQRVTRAVNGMQRRLAELLGERKVMLAALSHDLRTYLARMSLRIEGIAEAADRDAARGDFDAMAEMIDSTLAYSRLDGAPLEVAPLDLAALVADVARKLDVPFTTDAGPVRVDGDRSLLGRAVENLVGNAARHGGGGEIVLGVSDGRALIEVLDRGPGVPPERVSEVLRPFQRGDLARTLDVPGSGLGLAIVERAATAHGGTLTLTPRNGGGLRARIEVPLAAREPGAYRT